MKYDVPFRNVVWLAGCFFLLINFYNQQSGIYYNGGELEYYTDTLRERVIQHSSSKGKDYFEFQLSYTRSKFLIIDHGYSIIVEDKEKKRLVKNTPVDAIVKVGYLARYSDETNSNLNKMKALSLEINGVQLVTANEQYEHDQNLKRRNYLIGFGLVVFGFVLLVIGKTKRKDEQI